MGPGPGHSVPVEELTQPLVVHVISVLQLGFGSDPYSHSRFTGEHALFGVAGLGGHTGPPPPSCAGLPPSVGVPPSPSVNTLPPHPTATMTNHPARAIKLMLRLLALQYRK